MSVENTKSVPAAGKKVLFIIGPTASGKSALALAIAKACNGSIICADSRTIYKGMDIGTAKPTAAEQASVPHFGLDLIEPGQYFTTSDFKNYAEPIIVEIQQNGHLPIVVGGSGLYIDSLLFNFEFRPTNPKLRAQLEQLSDSELIVRAEQLRALSPDDRGNRRRLIRLIETGGQVPEPPKIREDALVVGLMPSKEILQARIAARIHAMIAAGLVTETKQLAERYGWQSEAMSANAYAVLKPVALGELTVDEVIDELVRRDQRLAKKQRTWFKRNQYVHWFDTNEAAERYILEELSSGLSND